MEIKKRLVLKHESGSYLSTDPDQQPNTRHISKARRFTNTEQISAFYQVSPYAPERPEEYEIQEIEIEYREVTADVQQIGVHQQDSGRASCF